MNAHSYEMEKTTLINEIDRTSLLINKLISNVDLELLNSQQLEKLKNYSEKNKKLKHKLESNEFEIALCTRQISQNPYPIRLLPS